MEQLNQVHLRGIVGSVDEVETKTGNLSITRLSIATSIAYKSKDGCHVVDTTWHTVTGYDIGTFSKGDKVDLTGRLRNRKYTNKDGEEHYMTDILVSEIHVIETDEPLTFQY